MVIAVDDLKANTEYTGYTAASSVILWFWEVVKAFNKEDMARFLQFVTGTSKVSMMCELTCLFWATIIQDLQHEKLSTFILQTVDLSSENSKYVIRA